MKEEAAIDQNKRKSKACVVKPFIYGNVATQIVPKYDMEGHEILSTTGDIANTHTWTCFLRNHDLYDGMQYISYVTFHLHPSFENPSITITNPPYFVQLDGWGQFEIKIEIHFVNEAESPVTLTHMLTLFHPNDENPPPKDNPVVKEISDEFVFYEPREFFYKMLTRPPQRALQYALPCADLLERYSSIYSMQQELLTKIQKAEDTVAEKLNDLLDHYRLAVAHVNVLKNQLESAPPPH